MDYFCAFSWPYAEDAERDARACFDALRANQMTCPYQDKRYEVCMAKSVRGNVFVGVLVLPGTSHDDSMDVFRKLEEWFEKSGVKNYEDYNHLPVRGSSTVATLGSAYEVLDYFGNLRPSTSSKASAGCAVLLAGVSVTALLLAVRFLL